MATYQTFQKKTNTTFEQRFVESLKSWLESTGKSQSLTKNKKKIYSNHCLYSYERIISIVPEQDHKLLNHIRRMEDRKKKKRDSRKSGKDQKSTSFDDILKDESDNSEQSSGEEEEEEEEEEDFIQSVDKYKKKVQQLRNFTVLILFYFSTKANNKIPILGLLKKTIQSTFLIQDQSRMLFVSIYLLIISLSKKNFLLSHKSQKQKQKTIGRKG